MHLVCQSSSCPPAPRRTCKPPWSLWYIESIGVSTFDGISLYILPIQPCPRNPLQHTGSASIMIHKLHDIHKHQSLTHLLSFLWASRTVIQPIVVIRTWTDLTSTNPQIVKNPSQSVNQPNSELARFIFNIRTSLTQKDISIPSAQASSKASWQHSFLSRILQLSWSSGKMILIYCRPLHRESFK